jgi:hypothetical protein
LKFHIIKKYEIMQVFIIKTYRHLNCGEEKEEVPGIESQE